MEEPYICLGCHPKRTYDTCKNKQDCGHLAFYEVAMKNPLLGREHKKKIKEMADRIHEAFKLAGLTNEEIDTVISNVSGMILKKGEGK